MPREGTTTKTMSLKEGKILYSTRGPHLTQGHGLHRASLWASGLSCLTYKMDKIVAVSTISLGISTRI